MVKTKRRSEPFQGIKGFFFLITSGLIVIAVILLISTIFSGSNKNPQSTSNGTTNLSDITKLRSSPTLLSTSTIIQTPTPIPIQNNTPTPTATATSTTTPTPTLDPWVEKSIHSMSLSELVGQMLLVGIDGQQPEAISCSYIGDVQPGGIVYRDGNVINPDQLRHLSAAIQACVSSGSIPYMLIAVDHEGQYVNRFDNGVNYFPPAMAIGASSDPQVAFNVAYAQGLELSYSGVNTVLGPVADVLTNLDNTVISQRSYGGDFQQVSNYVYQAVLGYQQAGLAAVLKHYPGHGGVSGDSHTVLPVDNSDLSALETAYLPPFQSGVEAGAQMIMTAHVAFPFIDSSGAPATLSSPIISVLRERLGYEGVILTDSMGMAAITSSGLDIPSASLEAIHSGVDMLLISSPEVAIQTKNLLLSALENGELSRERVEESVRRILSVKTMLNLDSVPQTAASPELGSGKEIAYNAGYHAPTIITDANDLIPLPTDKINLLIIAPPDAWGLDNLLTSNLEQRGFSVTIAHYGAPWNGSIENLALLADFIDRANRYDITLLFTWEAHLNRFRYGDTWQADLANRLIETGKPVVITALKSPTDLLEFPQAPAYLATFGTTPGQLQALVGILTGVIEPQGNNPVSNLGGN